MPKRSALAPDRSQPIAPAASLYCSRPSPPSACRCCRRAHAFRVSGGRKMSGSAGQPTCSRRFEACNRPRPFSSRNCLPHSSRELKREEVARPESLRFIAVGGARVSRDSGRACLELGIPVHEGYGLTECCSVVAVNRPGRRKAGTVGEPLRGLECTHRKRRDRRERTYGDGGLSSRASAIEAQWRTGDLGQSRRRTASSRHVGRKDNLLVTAAGRNISPEWVEAIVMSDARVAACVAARPWSRSFERADRALPVTAKSGADGAARPRSSLAARDLRRCAFLRRAKGLRRFVHAAGKALRPAHLEWPHHTRGGAWHLYPR